MAESKRSLHMSMFRLMMFFILLGVLFFTNLVHDVRLSSAAYSHTLPMTTTNEFYSSGSNNEIFSTSTNGYSASVTWDNTYIYLGYTGANINAEVDAANYSVQFYFGGENGTQTGDAVQNQTPQLPFQARYYIKWVGDDSILLFKSWDGTSWGVLDFAGISYRNGNYLVLKLPRSVIGDPKSLQITGFMMNENSENETTFAAFPASAYADGYSVSPEFTKSFHFDLTGNTAPVRQTALNFRSTAKTINTASFAFQAATGATAVGIQYSSNGGVNWNTASVQSALNAGSTTAVVTGLSDQTNYLFRLNVAGGSFAGTSVVAALTTDPAPESTPTPEPTEEPTPTETPEPTATPTVNQAPTNLSLSAVTIVENQDTNTTIGIFSTVDQDEDESFTYSLVSGVGSINNSNFEIFENELQSQMKFNYEQKNSYNIRVRTTDSAGAIFEKEFIIQITNQNEAPVAISLSSLTISENAEEQNQVGILTATDPDQSDTIVFGFNNDNLNDNDFFEIDSSNRLVAKQAFDYENKSTYSVIITATDLGELVYTKTFTIQVTNVNEAPQEIVLSNLSITENNSLQAVIGTFSTTDPDLNDTFTYLIINEEESDVWDHFSIIGNQLRAKTKLNFEENSSFLLSVRVTDKGDLILETDVTIAIQNVNEAPSAITISDLEIDENKDSGEIVGSILASDPDSGDTVTLSFVSGSESTNNDDFTISDSNLIANNSFNFEMKTTYKIRLRATDDIGLYIEKAFTIKVVNVNEAPTEVQMRVLIVEENREPGTKVSDLRTIDVDRGDSFTYTLSDGDGSDHNSYFQIEGNKVMIAESFNYELKNEYNIRIQSMDSGGLMVENAFVVQVKNANDAPSKVELAGNFAAENVKLLSVGTFTTTDEDVGDKFKYSLISGEDCSNSHFLIADNNLKIKKELDFETKNTHKICVRARDSKGKFVDGSFEIVVTDAGDKPSQLALNVNTVDENTSIGTEFATLSTTDQDAEDVFTYSLVPGKSSKDNVNFQIVDNKLTLKNDLNFEKQSVFNITVRTTDKDSLSIDKTFKIIVNDINESPTEIKLTTKSINENIKINSIVGKLSALDPDKKDKFVFAFSDEGEENQNQLFSIENATLRLKSALDYETHSTLKISLRVTDSKGLFFDQEFTIPVKDMNDAPTDLGLSNETITDKATKGNTVGTFQATDTDQTPQKYSYSLVKGEGSTDNSKFSISANALKTKFIADKETKGSYAIRVRVKDAGGFFEKTFTITVN